MFSWRTTARRAKILLRSLFLKTIRDLRGQIWGWGMGTGSLAVMVAALYPAFKDQMGIYVQMMSNYPPAITAFFGDMSRMAEWSGATGIRRKRRSHGRVVWP